MTTHLKITLILVAIVLVAVNAGTGAHALAQNDATAAASENPCLDHNGGCDRNATCAPLEFGVTCTCNAGYVGDGGDCVAASTPLTHVQTFVKAGDTARGGQFGTAVALSADGTTLAVGALAAGKVYVYGRVGETWAQTAVIGAGHDPEADPNEETDNAFGSAVSLSADGNTLGIGAQSASDGAAYVYRRAANAWSVVATLHEATAGWYGATLSLSADASTLAVGAQKVVHVYTSGAHGWTHETALRSQARPDDGFGGDDDYGNAVALNANGNTLAVGAPSADDGARESGAVYVYVRARHRWSVQKILKSPLPVDGDHFGASLALNADGNTIGVGEPNGNTYGNAYIYVRSGVSWALQMTFFARPRRFGGALSLSADGNTFVIGDEREEGSGTGIASSPRGGADQSGAAYLCTRVGTAWSFRAVIKATNTGANDNFGHAIALSADGTTMVAGAPHEDSASTGINPESHGDAEDSGAIYVYR